MAELTELGSDGLPARCGVHTGPVVVGELGVGEKRLCDGIVGEAPNTAARLQGLAAPGSLVMSEATLRLVEGFFEVEPLGPQVLKGVSAPITTYRVLRPSAAPNRFEARSGQFLTPLIGRETELAFLTKRWENAMEGEGQAVLLQGEAGIGKSRLLQTFRMQLRGTTHTEIVFYGSPQHQTSPLWPVIQQWNRALGFGGDKDDVAQRKRLAVCAVLAARDMTAERCRAAVLDRRHHLQLAEADMAGIGPTPRRAVAAEDVRDLQRWTRHAPRFRRAVRRPP